MLVIYLMIESLNISAYTQSVWVYHALKTLKLPPLNLLEIHPTFFIGRNNMSKKRTNVMADDAVYVIFIAAISMGLTILGWSLAFHG